MTHLDPVGRPTTDTLELSRAAATRHAHASALLEQRPPAHRVTTRRRRRFLNVLAMIPS